MAQGRQMLIPQSNPCQGGGHKLPWVFRAGLGVGWLPFSWRGHGLESESGLGVVQGILISREMLEFMWFQVLWSLLWPCAHREGWYGHDTRARKVLPPSNPRTGDISSAQEVHGPGEPCQCLYFPEDTGLQYPYVSWEIGIVHRK